MQLISSVVWFLLPVLFIVGLRFGSRFTAPLARLRTRFVCPRSWLFTRSRFGWFYLFCWFVGFSCSTLLLPFARFVVCLRLFGCYVAFLGWLFVVGWLLLVWLLVGWLRCLRFAVTRIWFAVVAVCGCLLTLVDIFTRFVGWLRCWLVVGLVPRWLYVCCYTFVLLRFGYLRFVFGLRCFTLVTFAWIDSRYVWLLRLLAVVALFGWLVARLVGLVVDWLFI